MKLLQALQAQIHDIITADPFFTPCAVVVIDRADITAELNRATAASRPAILIAPPSITFTPNAGIGPISTDGGVRITIQITEPFALARAAGLPSSIALAEHLGWLLHSCNHGHRHDTIPLGLAEITPLPDDTLLIIQLTFNTTAALTAPNPTGDYHGN